MKRRLPSFLILSYLVLGIVLILQMSEKTGPIHVIPPSSNYAIINVDSLDVAEGFLREFPSHPNQKVLIRVNSGEPTKISGKVKSDGNIYVINPNGVIVGSNAVIDLPESKPASTLDDTKKLKAHGNVYALKIKKEGKIQASKPIEWERMESSEQ